MIIDTPFVFGANVSPILDLTYDDCEPIAVFHRCVIDLSRVIDDVVTPNVIPKRCIVDLSTNDDDIIELPVIKRQRQRRLSDVKEYLEKELLIEKLRKLPGDLLMKIFDDYLDVLFIKKIMMTPKEILRTAIYIHHSVESRIIHPRALTDITNISKFIIEHVRERVEIFIIFALRNSVVLPTLQVNDTFDYYETNKSGKYIVLKVSKNSAIVQRIKYQELKLYYNGMVFITVVKVSKKRRISMKILNNRCIFSPVRGQSICFVNNLGTPTEIVYYDNDVVLVEKHRNMFNYIIE